LFENAGNIRASDESEGQYRFKVVLRISLAAHTQAAGASCAICADELK
jgi:hypothetical protein